MTCPPLCIDRTSPVDLLELEQRRILTAVIKLDDQLTAGPFPTLVGLPFVVVLIAAGSITKAAVARSLGLFEFPDWDVGVTGYFLRSRVAIGKDIQTLIAIQAELDRDGLTGRDLVDRRRVVDRAEEASETGDVQSQARALTVLSRVQESLGQYDKSLRSIREAVTLFKEADGSNSDGLAEALWQQGWVLHRMEKAQAALLVAREGYTLSQATHLRQAEARFLDLMGVINYYMLDHYDIAKRQLEGGLAVYRELGNQAGESSALNHMGENARLQGDFTQAARYYEEALAIARESQNHNGANLFMSNLCGARIGIGQFEMAVVDLEELIAVIRHDWFGLSEAYRFLSEAYLRQGKTAQALAMSQQARALANPSNLVENGRAWRMLGLVAAKLVVPILAEVEGDQLSDAAACFRRSLDFFVEAESKRDRAITLWNWAQHELEQGNKKQGQAMWQEARDIFTRLNLPLMVARMEAVSNKQ